MNSLNLGILAHVDAGKTSLTEHLLFESGVIQTLGSVDQGSTQTDSMALERQRGITIQSAVVSFTVGDLKINLIDTPGHPDFIAEVERVLSVLDAAVLVVSAVEGVQPQTRILMRTLKKLKIPTLIFINKVDRVGARSHELITEIQNKLSLGVVAVNEVANVGSRDAKITSTQIDDVELKEKIVHAEIHPIFFGSALTGVGVKDLIQALERYFSYNVTDTNSTLSAIVFKVERGPHDEKVAYLRMYGGELNARALVEIQRATANGVDMFAEKITAMQLFKDGVIVDAQSAHAGDIVKVFGLRDVAINDWIGKRSKDTVDYFARPSLEVVIAAQNSTDRPKLHQALIRVSEQDPLIQLRQSDRGKLSIRLYGEVQREIIQTLLQNEYGIIVLFEKTQTIYIEKVKGTGTAFADKMDKDNFFEATIGLKIEPGDPGSGIVFKIGFGRGSLPVAFQTAIEDTVYKTLQQGLYGWEVTDCVVEVTDAGYWDATSTGGDFRGLTPLLLMEALKKAETEVYEPLNRFQLDVPEAVLSQVLQSLAKAETKLTQAPTAEYGVSSIKGTIPVRRTFDFERDVPNLTQGEGAFTVEPGGYQKVHGSTPIRERTDFNPLNKQAYMGHILRRE